MKTFPLSLTRPLLVVLLALILVGCGGSSNNDNNSNSSSPIVGRWVLRSITTDTAGTDGGTSVHRETTCPGTINVSGIDLSCSGNETVEFKADNTLTSSGGDSATSAQGTYRYDSSNTLTTVITQPQDQAGTQTQNARISGNTLTVNTSSTGLSTAFIYVRQ